MRIHLSMPLVGVHFSWACISCGRASLGRASSCGRASLGRASLMGVPLSWACLSDGRASLMSVPF